MAELRIEKDDPKKIVPSAIYNNLATVGGLRIFAHKKEAAMLKAQSVRLLTLHVDASAGGSGSSNAITKRGTVTNVTAGLVEGKLAAAITSTDAIELWDLAKEVLVCSTSTATAAGAPSSPNTPNGPNPAASSSSLVFPQCTAFGTNNGASFFMSGFSNGDVAFYGVNGELQVTPLSRSKGRNDAVGVTAVATSPSPTSPILAASGDANGNLVMWGRGMAASLSVPPRQAGDCVTGIVCNGKFFVVTYGGGKMRLFSTTNGALLVEAAAHARWINAVALEPTHLNHVATCSDDGSVLVWELPTGGDGTSALTGSLKLIGQKFIKNYLWTGVAFGEVGQLFANAYDVDRAYTFSY